MDFQEEQQHTAVTDSKAIIEELRQSDETAEAILDRERKRQIEIDLEEKEKAAERKRRNRGRLTSSNNTFPPSELIQGRKRAAETMSFSTAQRQVGRNYVYQPLHLLMNGPPVPARDDLQQLGYLQHIKRPSPVSSSAQERKNLNPFQHRLAGGFTAQTACQRALFESHIDLFAC